MQVQIYKTTFDLQVIILKNIFYVKFKYKVKLPN